jgi:hypothetical protein
MAYNGFTTVGARVAIDALCALQPYVALLTGLPASGTDDPTSTDILAKECAMGGYSRLRVINWTPDSTARPPVSSNTSQLTSPGPLSGTVQTLTHYALVQNPTGATGNIWSVGILDNVLTLVVGKQLYIPAGVIRIGAD